MGMNSGANGNTVSEINVTPLIDVLLVLLIIFMVIVPVVPRGLNALIPQPPSKDRDIETPPSTIVVQVLADGAYRINADSFTREQVEPKLAAIFATRAEKTMFVKGAQELDYSTIAEVIDFGKRAGVDHIGLITPKVESGN